MKDDNVIIKESNIHRKGIFADGNFEKGEVVLHWDMSEVITKEEFDKMSENEKKYFTLCNGKYTKMQSPENHMNYSCNANTQIKNFCDVALRDIKKGEEITTTEKMNFMGRCNCGECC